VIPGLTTEHSQAILELLRSSQAVKEIRLYGSRAKGNFREGSDIDIALKGVDQKERDRLLLAYDELYLPWALDLVVYEQLESPTLKDHIDRVGKVLFSR
jgi:predicted nucleotidyltransferase